MPKTPDSEHNPQPEELEPGEIELYEEKFADQPFTHPRRHKPRTLQLLDDAIHSKKGQNKQQQLLNLAALSIQRTNRPITQREEQRIRILHRRYPDGPWSNFLPLEIFRRQFNLNQFSLHKLCKTPWDLPIESEPLFGSLFSEEAERLLALTEYLTGASHTTMLPLFLDKNKQMSPFQNEKHFISSSHTYQNLLDYYSYDGYNYYDTPPDTTITFAQVIHSGTHEEQLSLSIIPKKSFQDRELSHIIQNDKPHYQLLTNADLVVMWEGKKKNNKQIIHELKELCYEDT